jgi:repressor LexA
MKALTARQQEILDFIEQQIAQEGSPPTYEEIGRSFGFLPAAARDHLRLLEQKGVIALQAGKARGIRVLHSKPVIPVDIWRLPLVGRVAAGQPIESDAHIEREISVDRYLFRPRPHYLLRVEGMSMRDAGILDRDLIAVHRTADASNGQIVVARIDGEITVKTFQRGLRAYPRGENQEASGHDPSARQERITLLPANPDFIPIEIDPQTTDFAIEGLYVGVIRLP